MHTLSKPSLRVAHGADAQLLQLRDLAAQRDKAESVVVETFYSLTQRHRFNQHLGPRHVQFFVAVDLALVSVETFQFHARWR